MKKEYLTWINDLESLPQGKEIQLVIRDLNPGKRKYEARVVKAILADSPEKIPEGDILRFRSPVGRLLPETWTIKITEEVADYLPGTPYQELVSMQ